jgi:excisionase family DNA binding protein
VTVTQKEASRRLGVHVNTVAAMLDDGRLKAIDIGNGAGVYRVTGMWTSRPSTV